MISAEDLEAGQTAYTRVGAFAALRRRRMGLIYVLFPVLLMIAGAVAWRYGKNFIAVACAGSAVADAFFAGWNWRRLRRDDVRHRALLARLQAQYGDELPWLQAERQMVEIRRIQAEEARGAATAGEP